MEMPGCCCPGVAIMEMSRIGIAVHLSASSAGNLTVNVADVYGADVLGDVALPPPARPLSRAPMSLWVSVRFWIGRRQLAAFLKPACPTPM